MSPYFALYTVENNKNKKSVKFQGDMLNFCDFIQVFVFTRNHHLNLIFLKIQTVSNYGLKNYFTSFKISPIFSNRIKTDTVCA